MITIARQCPMCHNTFAIKVPAEGYKAWVAGKAHIQDAMPTVPAEDREMLMSGICKTCWDKFLLSEE